MGYGVSQGERTSPAAAENMHFAGDVQLPTQFQYVLDKMLGRIVGKGCCRVVVASAGCVFPQPRWSKRMTRYRSGLKKRAEEL